MDPISKVSLIPWTFFNLRHILEISFARVTSHYGLLISLYYIGRVLGRSFKYHTELPPLSPIFLLLAISFFTLGVTSRFAVVCLCYSLIGFGGAILRSICFPNVDEEAKYGTKNVTKKTFNDYHDTFVICVIFVPLLVGFTYSTAITARNPPFLLCSTFGILCFLCALRFLWLETSCFSACYSNIDEFAKRETDNSCGDEKGYSTAGNFNSLDGVTEDSVHPPENFMKVCGDDEAAAKKMFFNTLKWRAKERMDEIVEIPQNPDTFANILKYYPHGFQGRTLEGAAVVYELLGKASASQLSSHGITPQNLLRHFLLRNEFIHTKCSKNYRDGALDESQGRIVSDDDEPVTQLMSILDVNGVGFYSVNTDVISYIKISSEIMDAHYPNVVVRLAVINSPSWFYTIWSGIARVLPESVKKKVVFINNMKDLDEYIDPSMRPPEYGGTGCKLGESADNKEFLNLPKHWAEIEAASIESQLPPQDVVVEKREEVEDTYEKKSMGDWLQGFIRRDNNHGSVNKIEAYMGERNRYMSAFVACAVDIYSY